MHVRDKHAILGDIDAWDYISSYTHQKNDAQSQERSLLKNAPMAGEILVSLSDSDAESDGREGKCRSTTASTQATTKTSTVDDSTKMEACLLRQLKKKCFESPCDPKVQDYLKFDAEQTPKMFEEAEELLQEAAKNADVVGECILMVKHNGKIEMQEWKNQCSAALQKYQKCLDESVETTVTAAAAA